MNKMDKKDQLLKKIMITDFMATDLQLYLNTHQNDMQALQMYNEAAAKAEVLKEEYQRDYGPLTGFRSQDTAGWRWNDKPWPWNPEGNFSWEDK